MRDTPWRLLAWVLVLVVAGLSGCSLLSPKVADPSAEAGSGAMGKASKATSRPTTTPAGEAAADDPAKALLPLESIPPIVEPPEPKEDPNRAIPSQAVKHYLAARDHYHRWMNTEAIAELEEALRYDPGSYDIHLLLGRAALRAGNAGQARNHLREAAKLRPGSITPQYLLGRLAAKDKDWEAALRRYRLALQAEDAQPDRAETVMTHFGLGDVLLKQGYLAAAIKQLEAYERATADPRGHLWRDRELVTLARTQHAIAPLAIGRAALILHRYEQAAAAFERALEFQPDDFRTQVRYAQALTRCGRLDEAIAIAEELLLGKEHRKAGLELFGWIYRDLGTPRELTQTLERLQAEHPDRHDLGVMLADALIGMNQMSNAERVLRRLVQDYPKLTEAYVRLASLLTEHERYGEAMRVLAQALRAGRENHTGVIRVLGKIGGTTETARAIVAQSDAILGEAPDDYALSYVLGMTAMYADRPETAIRLFNRTTEIKEDFLLAYLSLGKLHLDRYEWSKAIEVAKRAEKASGRTPVTTYLLAQGYDGLDEATEAIEAYKEVIESQPKSVPAMISLGKLYERMGQKNLAQKMYQQALSIAPSSDEAGERLVRLLISRGDAKEAQRILVQLQRAGVKRGVLGRCLAVLRSGGDMNRYRYLLNKLLENEPKDAETYYDLALSYYSTKDYEDAGKLVDKVLELSPGHPKARLLMAQLCRKRLDFESAKKVLLGLLREHPFRPAWMIALAETYLDQQDYERAAELFRQLLERSEQTGRRAAYYLRLIGIYAAADENDEAIALAEAWHREDSDSLTAQRMLLEALHEAGKDERAVALAKTWLGGTPVQSPSQDRQEKRKADAQRLERRSMLLSVYAAADRHEEAIETLVSWLEKDPSNRALLRQLWLAMTRAKRYDDAVELCRNAMVATDRPQVYQMMLAQSYLEADDYDRALKLLEDLPGRENDELVARFRIMTYLEAGQLARALAVAQKAQAHADDDESRLAMTRLLVLVYQRQGKMAQAEREMQKLYEKDPKDPGVNNDLGYTMADAGHNLDQAEKMIRFALGEEPRNAAYMDSLGWVLYKKGDFAGAVEYLRKASRAQGGGDPVIFDHLGDALWRLGRREEAGQSWRKAVALAEKDQEEGKEPSDPDVLSRVRKKLAAVKQGDEPPVAAVVAPTRTETRPARAEVGASAK